MLAIFDREPSWFNLGMPQFGLMPTGAASVSFDNPLNVVGEARSSCVAATR